MAKFGINLADKIERYSKKIATENQAFFREKATLKIKLAMKKYRDKIEIAYRENIEKLALNREYSMGLYVEGLGNPPDLEIKSEYWERNYRVEAQHILIKKNSKNVILIKNNAKNVLDNIIVNGKVLGQKDGWLAVKPSDEVVLEAKHFYVKDIIAQLSEKVRKEKQAAKTPDSVEIFRPASY